MVISGKLDHTHEVDEQKPECKQVRLSVKRKKANSDVSERPSKIIRSELQKVENNLTENDLLPPPPGVHG